MVNREDLDREMARVREDLDDAGGEERELLTRHGCAPKAADAIAEDRSLRVYAYLTGQISGPISQSELVRSDPRTLEKMTRVWLAGLLLGLYLHPGAELALGHLQLAEGARSLDALAEEQGGEAVWAVLGVAVEAMLELTRERGSLAADQLKVTGGGLPDDPRVRGMAGQALWQDGVAVALLARQTAARAVEGEGPRPGSDLPDAEQ